VAADPAGFLRVNGDLLDIRTGQAFPTSIWWPFTPAAGAGDRAFHEIPGWLGLASHPLIIALSVAVALAFRADMRRDPRAVVPSVLALVFLLRAALDPVNNSYYHLPFLLTLIAADVLSGSILASLVATAAFMVLIQLAPYPATQAVVYLICAGVSTAYLWQRARGRDWLGGLDSRAAGQAVQTRSRGET
jgi:hypothetical protein